MSRSSEFRNQPIVNVVRVEPREGFNLWVEFNDGRRGVADFSWIFDERGSMLIPLRDPEFFRKVFIEFGALTWPNGFDVAPDALYAELNDKGRLATVEERVPATAAEPTPSIRRAPQRRPGRGYAFELYRDRAGGYRVRFKAPNGEKVFQSEGYSSKAAASRAIKAIITNVADADIRDHVAASKPESAAKAAKSKQ
jgi:uncharacterized protein YegP (UPF0339 family)